MSINDAGNHYSRLLAKEMAFMLLSATLLSYSFHKSRDTFVFHNFAGNVPS